MPDILDQIAKEIGEVTEQQDSNEEDPDKESDEDFDVEEYRRSKDEYDGGW